MTLLRHRDRLEGDLVIEVAFTDIQYDVGDDALSRGDASGLYAIKAATSATPVAMHQVHGNDVAVAGEDPLPDADALITQRPGLCLMARAADCVPVLLADPDTGWIAAVHAGRPGLAAGVVPSAVAAVRERGGQPSTAWIGPHVCGACYEVPATMQEEVAALVPEARSTTSWGTPSLDLGAGVRAQLEHAGIRDIRTVEVCTREDRRWPSYRRDGAATTRFAGLVWRNA